MVSKAKRSRLPVRQLNQGAGSPAAGGALPGGAVTGHSDGGGPPEPMAPMARRVTLPARTDLSRRGVHRGPVDVIDGGYDVLGTGEGWRHRPALVGVVADAHRSGGSRLVAGYDRIGVV